MGWAHPIPVTPRQNGGRLKWRPPLEWCQEPLTHCVRTLCVLSLALGVSWLSVIPKKGCVICQLHVMGGIISSHLHKGASMKREMLFCLACFLKERKFLKLFWKREFAWRVQYLLLSEIKHCPAWTITRLTNIFDRFNFVICQFELLYDQ